MILHSLEGDNTWHGDVVRADVPPTSGNLSGPTVAGLVLCLFVGIAVAMVTNSFALVVLTFLAVAALGVMVDRMTRSAARAAAAEAAGRAQVVLTLGELARHCFLTGIAKGAARREPFDAERWLATVSRWAPRVVVCGGELPTIPSAADTFEEIDLLTDTPLGPRGRRAVLVGLLLFSFQLLNAIFQLSNPVYRGAAGVVWMRWALVAAFVGLVSVQALLLFPRWPLRLNTVVAAPGSVACAGLAGKVDFTRDDSVLVIRLRQRSRNEGRQRFSLATLCRRDGRRKVFLLRDHEQDPLLVALLSRWCRRENFDPSRPATLEGEAIVSVFQPPVTA